MPESDIEQLVEGKQEEENIDEEDMDMDCDDDDDDVIYMYPSSPQEEYSTEQETESESDMSAAETDEAKDQRVHVTDDSLRTQSKHVVFLTQLLMLF